MSRKLDGRTKYRNGDSVKFITKGEEHIGTISIIDSYGYMDYFDEEPSYDILVEGKNRCLYKHVGESWVIGLEE